MLTYYETLAIFIFCAFLYPTENINVISLTFILLAFILTCFFTTVKNEYLRTVLSIISLIICIFYHDFVCFLPALFYNPCFHKKYLFPAVGIIPALYYKHQASQDMLMLLCAFCISYYLAIRSHEREYLQTTVRQLRDNSVEQQMHLKHSHNQLLASQDDKIYIATLKERNRIAREIHDNVGHMLSRSILQVGALLAICKDEITKNHLTQLKSSLNEAMNSIRNSVHDLHDESVDLKSSLENLVGNFTFCPISFACNVSRHVPKDVKYCFIAIVKEALNNVIRHSNATKVSITVKEHPGLYQLLIEDNGTKPFSAADSSGIGLSNMKDRADALHGIIHITSEHGVKIFLSIPK